jgi:hypothetical protein
MFYLSLTQINRALLTLSLLFLQQYLLIVWMLVAPMIWKCRQAGSTWESQNNHSNYEILLRIKIFKQSQISGVHIGDSSSSAVCIYEKELQLRSFRKFLMDSRQKQCFWHKCTRILVGLDSCYFRKKIYSPFTLWSD